jgi:hypothetical protein
MRNAKEEMIERLNSLKNIYGADIICANITHTTYESYFTDDEDDVETPAITLKKGYTEAEYDAFLSKLDFEYDAGYGAQYVFGYVWLTNGVWMDRGEYDGSEWWEWHKYPQIPDELL